MRVIYEDRRRVIVTAKNRIKVVMPGVQGPPGIPPDTYAAHMTDYDNPHRVQLLQLLAESYQAGKWVRINDTGTGVIAVDPPLTEVPELPAPTDDKVKADPGDPESGYLAQKVQGCIVVDTVMHLVRLKGAAASAYQPNYYYGTNDAGQLGFWPLPASLIQECGIGVEDEDEWLNTGAVGFYGWP